MGRWALLVIILAGCAKHATDEVDRARCERLRGHLVDLRVAELGELHVDVAKHRAALQQALGDDFVSTCLASVTSEQMKCALAAGDSASASSCTSK